MPGKGRRRAKSGYGKKRVEPASDEDSLSNDESSVTSGFSDYRSFIDDANNDNNETEEVSPQEELEDETVHVIDGLSQKSAKGRTSCLKKMERIFVLKYLPDFVGDRQMTITHCIERSLKKGEGEEQCLAARLSIALCVQLGAFDDCSQNISTTLKPIVTTIACDTSVHPSVRSECCWALSMNQFFAGDDTGNLYETFQLLSTIFSGSFLKGNGTIATVSTEMAALHVTAITSWTVLLSVMAPSEIYNLISSERTNNLMPSLVQIKELLQSPHLDVRLAAGEALGVIFELGREYSSDYEKDWVYDVIDDLKNLANDSNKYRAKKDRKLQRASFRDILRYIEENIEPEAEVKFGSETLHLVGWCARIQYNACCKVLGPGINIHLAENQLLREIFQLRDRVLPTPKSQKTSKLERALNNAAAFKARTKQRSKNRDKRFVIVGN